MERRENPWIPLDFQRKRPAFAGPYGRLVCPIAMVFAVHGVCFHVGDKLPCGQHSPAGADRIAASRGGCWLRFGRGRCWRLRWLRCRIGRDSGGLLGRWLFFGRFCGFGFRRVGWRLRSGDIRPVHRCWRRIRRTGDGRVWPIYGICGGCLLAGYFLGFFGWFGCGWLGFFDWFWECWQGFGFLLPYNYRCWMRSYYPASGKSWP